MASVRTFRAIMGGATLLLLAGGLYVLARTDEAGAEADARPIVAARDSDAPTAPVELPAARPAQAESLTTSAQGAAASDTGSGGAPTAAPVALTDIGEVITLSGRVVDESGAPVAGAEVIHVASPAVIKALGRKPIPFGPQKPWDDFVRTRTDERGLFALRTNELPRPEREARPPVQDNAYVEHQDTVPSLAVIHPVYQAVLHVCRGYRAGDYDAGDIALRL